MIPLSRRYVILLAAVALAIVTLVITARTTDYDDEVYRYVSDKIDKFKGSQAQHTTPSGAADTGPDKFPTQPHHDNPALESYPFPELSTTIDVPKQQYFDPKGPQSNQIAILTATDGGGHNRDIHNLTEQIRENRDIYAKHHGYIHYFADVTKYDLRDVHPVWKKIPALVETFKLYPEVEWVFWMDADAVIMTPTQDLQSLILSKEGMQRQLNLGETIITETADDLYLHSPREFDFESVDFIIAQDWNGINAGSFLVRRSHFTQLLLDMWADPLFMYSNFERLEQDALRHILKHHPSVRSHVGIAKQRAINAYPTEHPEKPESQWQPGDLLVHFAGCWVYGTCQKDWDYIWPQRGLLP